jgi:hypothetical protein
VEAGIRRKNFHRCLWYYLYWQHCNFSRVSFRTTNEECLFKDTDVRFINLNVKMERVYIYPGNNTVIKGK